MTVDRRQLNRLKPHTRVALALTVAFFLLSACRDEAPREEPVPSVAIDPPDPQKSTLEQAQRELNEAQQALERALAEPGLPGAAQFEAARATLLSRAKAEPIVFERAPEADDSGNTARHFRNRLWTHPYSWDVLHKLIPAFALQPELGRKTLLREGYLYAENPDLAFALVSQIGLQHLFHDPRVWIQRGESLVYAIRGKHGKYFYETGPLAGEVVKLMHLDRVGTGEPSAPLHVDFRALRYRVHFDRARVRHITKEQVVADLLYGDLWVPTLLSRQGARLDVAHQVILPEQAAPLAQARDEARRRFRAIGALQQAILEQVYEGLPFDEPLTEVKQQDGRLRPIWVYLYLRNQTSYKFQGDRYPIFDRQGRPLVPQVCADFLIDTFERASGTWWQPAGKPPGRTPGRLDLEEDRASLRRTAELVQFFTRHPNWFDVRAIPEREQLPMGMKSEFFTWIAEHAQYFDPGSVVLIRGKTPWDKREEHTHSFFVLDTDPITGVPLAVVGNPGRPIIWSWETEARRTPLRTLRHIVRPKLAWLEQVIDPALASELTPPPLAVESSSRPGW